MAPPEGSGSDIFVQRRREWTEDEKRAITATHLRLAKTPALAKAFEYICNRQGDNLIGGPLEAREVMTANGLDREKQLTELRERAAYHSAYLDSNDCPFVIVIERHVCRLRMIPKHGRPKLHLHDLTALERLEPEGRLVPGSEIVIYVHQATGLPPSLLEQMLKNMVSGVTYRYFIPCSYSKHVTDLVMEVFGHATTSPKQTMRILAAGFQVNVVAESMPVFFSIHNATNDERAVMFVRSPASSFVTNPALSKELIIYGDNRWAHEQYRVMMRLWKPRARTPRSPIVLPCQDVKLPTETRMELIRRLNAEPLTKPLAEEIITAVLGANKGGKYIAS